MYIHKHMYILKLIYIYIYVYTIHINIYTQVYIYILIYIYTHIYIYIHIPRLSTIGKHRCAYCTYHSIFRCGRTLGILFTGFIYRRMYIIYIYNSYIYIHVYICNHMYINMYLYIHTGTGQGCCRRSGFELHRVAVSVTGLVSKT